MESWLSTRNRRAFVKASSARTSAHPAPRPNDAADELHRSHRQVGIARLLGIVPDHRNTPGARRARDALDNPPAVHPPNIDAVPQPPCRVAPHTEKAVARVHGRPTHSDPDPHAVTRPRAAPEAHQT